MSPIACIILPTYNEAQNVAKIIQGIFDQQKKIHSHEIHVLVVDDNSPDGTQDVVQKSFRDNPNLHLLTGIKRGLGEAYKRGIRYAIDQLAPDLIFEMDADGQHDPNNIPFFILAANHGFSLVIGSRFAPGGSTPDFSIRRKAISVTGNWMIRFLGGIPRIHDCTSGFRCIKASLLPECNLNFLSTRGYSFQSSLLCELLRNDARVIEVPITFPDRVHGESKLSFSDQIEFLLNIPKIRFHQSEEFMKFCVVGFSGVILNLGLYIVLTRFFAVDIKLASPICIEISILSNFFFNHVWTFNKRKNTTPWLKKLMSFHVVAGIAGISNYTLFLLMITSFHFNDILANLIGIGFGTIINYSINSLWTWRDQLAD